MTIEDQYHQAPVAQRIEHLTTDQKVRGSNPFGRTQRLRFPGGPTTLLEAQDYATGVIDLENTIVEKMNQLTNEEYESILRPVCKDDEPLMIAVGAILGGFVGELQVQVIELFTH